MAPDPRDLFPTTTASAAPPAPLSGTRAERVQRVQIGLFGLVTMILLVALADIVISRARETQSTVVPEAARVAKEGEAAPRDPLADAGVVPELGTGTPAERPAPPQESGDVPPPPTQP